MSLIDDAAKWAAEEYAKRTEKIAEGKFVDIKCLNPQKRITWDEVAIQFGIKHSNLIMLEKFGLAFKKEMNKKKLTNVLAGKETPQDWLKRKNNV